ncbi:hypothetical protein BK816_03580 [Boudabousia tangfeifanii]|uniref:GP-PDE domain-containing protein n=1 Tax=Boudabousia tangfeifanii TaxID=1912795 RepID=A0A1D9MJU8_9ACTO|nr:glycerophosphodiester phosphodiesterase family protein [Boudabousia tangfeifanii]AOZ72488.1 hypothetical protein BK816_03580 [Boudabousia tangfeifanii]
MIQPKEWTPGSKTLVFAHRGSPLLGDFENSEAAFCNALATGAEAIESDIQVTKDGVAVLSHDPTLKRLFGQDLSIAKLAWKEIRAVTRDYSAPLLRLDEALDCFSETTFNLDTKCDAAVEAALPILLQPKVRDRVCVATFSDRRMQRVRQGAKGALATSLSTKEVLRLLRLSYSPRANQLKPADLAKVLSISPEHAGPVVAAQIPYRFKGTFKVLSPNVITTAHKLGLNLQVWTVNNSSEIEQITNPESPLRVDGVITDRLQSALTIRDSFLA